MNAWLANSSRSSRSLPAVFNCIICFYFLCVKHPRGMHKMLVCVIPNFQQTNVWTTLKYHGRELQLYQPNFFFENIRKNAKAQHCIEIHSDRSANSSMNSEIYQLWHIRSNLGMSRAGAKL